jgi:hypothetical protein
VVTDDPRGLGRSVRKDGRVDNAPTVQAGDLHALIEVLEAKIVTTERTDRDLGPIKGASEPAPTPVPASRHGRPDLRQPRAASAAEDRHELLDSCSPQPISGRVVGRPIGIPCIACARPNVAGAVRTGLT